jgi:hypothetical protein
LKYTDPDGENPLIVIGIMALAGAYTGGAIAAGSGGLSGANWNPFGGSGGSWAGTDWYKGALIGAGFGAVAGAGIAYIGPIAAKGLWAAGLKGNGLAASTLGYGTSGAVFGGAAGFGTGYFTDRWANGASHSEALKTGWDLAKWGAIFGASVGMTYGLTPGGFERIASEPLAGSCAKWGKTFPSSYPKSYTPHYAGKTKTVYRWVERSYWSKSTSSAIGLAASGAAIYALPPQPPWIGNPNFRGPFFWYQGAMNNMDFFYPNGSNPAVSIFNRFPVPWGGTYIDNMNMDFGWTYEQRIAIRKRAWFSFFGLFTIWRI